MSSSTQGTEAVERTGPSIYRAAADAELDPVSYEILRHRLWEINSEQATTIMKVSPSPVASEAQDFNVMLADGAGAVCYVGPFAQFHAVIMDLLIQRTLETRGKDVGIEPGDMFLTNDPYLGAAHYNDVAVLAPFFHEGELLAWTGSMLHNIDVGGANVGSFCIDAPDMFSEPTGFPPVKIVEGGEIRGDIEELYLRQSRTPAMLALDLRAQIAANNVAHRRLEEVCGRYGPEAVAVTLRRTLDEAEAGLREKLRELPDGEWHHREFMDRAAGEDFGIHAARGTLSKRGDKIVIDVTESDPQTGHINVTKGLLRAASMFPVIQILSWDLPWASSGLLRCVEIESKPGTIMDAQPPACVSAATLPGLFVVQCLAQQLVCQMMCASETFARDVIALDTGSFTMLMIHGANKDGTPYQTMLMDPIGGAVGARSWKDGVNTGGYVHSPNSRMVDAEINELLYPILYLFRREALDSGGPGRWRGGATLELAIVPHETEGIAYQTLARGVTFSSGVGLAGGLPGAPVEYRLLRDTEVAARIADGEIPQEASVEALGGSLEWPSFRGHFEQGASDVVYARAASSGGFGDPLAREAERVAADVVDGYVSVETARVVHGVVCDEAGAVDAEATAAARKALVEERLGGAVDAGAAKVAEGAERLGQIHSGVGIYAEGGGDGGGTACACESCRTRLSGGAENYKDGCHEAVGPLDELPYHPDPRRYEMDAYLELRRYFCRGCGAQLAADLALPGEATVLDARVEVGTAA
jgi:N-methylhydantoinase B